MKWIWRTTALTLCTLLIVSALTGCGRGGYLPEQQPKPDQVAYTNLKDTGSQQLLQGLLSAAGVCVGHKFGAKYEDKATLAGGIILILIGTKILLEHLGFIG